MDIENLDLLESIESDDAFQQYSLKTHKEVFHTANHIMNIFRNVTINLFNLIQA